MSWDDLSGAAGSTGVGAALDREAELRRQGRGGPHVQSTLRLFDANDKEDDKKPGIILYRDHAGWCVCVRLCGCATKKHWAFVVRSPRSLLCVSLDEWIAFSPFLLSRVPQVPVLVRSRSLATLEASVPGLPGRLGLPAISFPHAHAFVCWYRLVK
jgi:hypothetical protein